MQTNIELAGAGGQAIALPLSTPGQRQIAAVERPARQASLFTVVKEVRRAERWETLVWVGIAVAAVALLVMSFAMRQSPPPHVGGYESKNQFVADAMDRQQMFGCVAVVAQFFS